VAPQEAGGTRHYEFARHLVDHGHQVTIVASTLSYLSGEGFSGSEGLAVQQDLDGVRVVRAYTYPSLHRSYVWRVVSFCTFMVTSVWGGLCAGPIDLVMGTSPPIFQAVSAWLLALLRGRPLLLEVRDLWPEFAIDMGVLTNPVLVALSRRLERFLYGRATHILVNSPAYRDYLFTKGLPAAKVALIPNGTDPAMFDPEDQGERIRQRYNLTGKFVAVYAGALGLANDIGVILGAANRLRDQRHIHILLVGDGKERPVLEKLAAELNLPNITFAGAHPKSEMRDFLAAADVGLATLQDIPMFRMTYPNKVFDYMAAGRPTVLGIDGAIREVIDAAGGGVFVPPGDERAFADALLQLSLASDRVRQMGRSAREYVVRNFNRHSHAAAFLSLAQQLVSM
jgi:glycosyltransferase involved in cell wall biosynthesis